MKKVVPFLSDSIPVSVSLSRRIGVCGAMLINQIHFWSASRTNIRLGDYWTHQSYGQWTEMLPFSESTIRTALKEIENLGLIIVGNFNQKSYDRTKWYRLDYGHPLLNLTTHLSEINTTHLSEINTSGVEIPPMHVSEIDITIPYINLKEETYKENIKMKIEKNKSETKQPAKKPSSVDSVLAALQIQNGAVVPTNVKETMRLVWREVPKYNKNVGMVPVLTGKDMKLLTYIGTSVGPTCGQVLRHVISHWIAFTKFVESAKAIQKTPSVPDISFVVKYVTEAVSFYKQSLQSVAPKSKTDKMVVPVKPATPAISTNIQLPVEIEEVATLNDVFAWQPKLK